MLSASRQPAVLPSAVLRAIPYKYIFKPFPFLINTLSRDFHNPTNASEIASSTSCTGYPASMDLQILLTAPPYCSMASSIPCAASAFISCNNCSSGILHASFIFFLKDLSLTYSYIISKIPRIGEKIFLAVWAFAA